MSNSTPEATAREMIWKDKRLCDMTKAELIAAVMESQTVLAETIIRSDRDSVTALAAAEARGQAQGIAINAALVIGLKRDSQLAHAQLAEADARGPAPQAEVKAEPWNIQRMCEGCRRG